jgi:glycosyltransferase involved in cell wall biosynthesis
VSAGRDSAGKIRVLVLIDRPSLAGGGERLAVQTAIRLDPGRFETTLCATRWDPTEATSDVVAPALADLRAAGVEFLGLKRRSTFSLASWARLASELRRHRIDVLHAHKFGSNVWGTLVGRLARVPVVIAHEHTWSYVGRPLRRLLDRHLIARGTDAFLAVSAEDMRRMIEIEGISARDVLMVPNGIPPLPSARRDVRRELGIPADAPVIGTVTRLYRQKAPEVVVLAAARLAAGFPGLQVLIVGAGPEESRVRALIDAQGLSDTVRLLGLRDDVPEVLAALDVAVSTSDWEGSPLSVIEYMAAGLPVVATAVGGVPDLITDGVHGLLVPRGDSAALAAAVERLLRNPEDAHAMGRRGRDRQRREFDLDSMVRRLERLYEDLHASARTRHRREASRSVLDAHRHAPLPTSSRG